MATLTAEALRQLEFVLKGPVHDLVGALTLVNLAGQHTVNLASWRWLARPEYLATLTAAQPYVSLPSDFGELLTTPDFPGLAMVLSMVSFQDLTAFRGGSISPGGNAYWGTIEYAISTTPPTNLLTPRIAIHPPPQTTQASVLRIFYRATWATVRDDTTNIAIPDFLRPLYFEVLRQFAEGYERPRLGTVSERLALVERGPLLAAAKRIDRAVQPTYGVSRGGAMETQGGNWRTNFNPVADPS